MSRGGSSGINPQQQPGVASMACAGGIAAGKTQRGLRMQPATILSSVCRPTETCQSLFTTVPACTLQHC